MDGLNNAFGLTVGPGMTGSKLAMSDLLHSVRVADADAADASVISRRLQSELDFGSRPFVRVLDEMLTAHDPHAPIMSDVVKHMGSAGYQAVMQKVELAERKRATIAAARSLSTSALVPVVQGMAASMSILLSQPLVELVQKLATASEGMSGIARDRADQSFRGLIRHLVERWAESQVSRGSGGFEAMFMNDAQTKSSIAPEPSRVIALSLESGAVGSAVWTAVRELTLTESGVRTLIDMITQAADSAAKRTLTEQIATAPRLTSLLRESEIDFAAVDMMVNYLGANAAKPLLDELVAAPGRGTRRALMDRLVRLGPDIAPHVLERLGDQRWFVVRNMISLLRETDAGVEPAQLDAFVTHADARVRREVLQLRMDNDETRDAAVTAALKDTDKNVLRTALHTARSTLPPAAIHVLADRVVDPNFPPEFRVMSLYLLGRTADPAARDALVAYASGGKSLFGKAKLAAKSPEMLAALSGLARSWSSDAKATELLDVAEKSRDEQILNALKAVGGQNQ